VRELALHILDIAENSVAAGARKVLIAVEEDLPKDRLRIVVEDDGRGMEEELLSRVTDPFVTSRTTRKVGLGIPLLKAAAEACNGSLCLTSTVGKGTRLEVEFQHSHIDRMPLGDLAGTILTLVVGHPTVNWVFVYRVGKAEFTFDDNPIKQELDGIPLTEPSILAFIKEMLREGIAQAQQDGRARE
jgi:hypothetical protein